MDLSPYITPPADGRGECSIVYESDGDGGGPPMGVIIEGHVEDDVAVPLAEGFAAWEGIEELFAAGMDRPRRVWLTEFPWCECCDSDADRCTCTETCGHDEGTHVVRYFYAETCIYGGRPVTVVEAQYGWREKCGVRGCYWQARSGYPERHFMLRLIPPSWKVTPEVSTNGMPPTTYLCAGHSFVLDDLEAIDARERRRAAQR